MKGKGLIYVLALVWVLSSIQAQHNIITQKVLTETNSKELRVIQKKSHKILSEQQRKVNSLLMKGYKRIITTSKGEYSELIGADSKGSPIYYITSNFEAGKLINAHSLNTGGDLGLNLNGQGMQIFMWDAGRPRLTHQLFGGRVVYADPISDAPILRHPTHIAGTMIGNFSGNERAKGIAWQANLKAYNWLNDDVEMIEAARTGALVANNSYGYNPIYM